MDAEAPTPPPPLLPSVCTVDSLLAASPNLVVLVDVGLEGELKLKPKPELEWESEKEGKLGWGQCLIADCVHCCFCLVFCSLFFFAPFFLRHRLIGLAFGFVLLFYIYLSHIR